MKRLKYISRLKRSLIFFVLKPTKLSGLKKENEKKEGKNTKKRFLPADFETRRKKKKVKRQKKFLPADLENL